MTPSSVSPQLRTSPRRSGIALNTGSKEARNRSRPAHRRSERLRQEHVRMDAGEEVLEETLARTGAPSTVEEVDELGGRRTRLGDGHAATSSAAAAICCWIVIESTYVSFVFTRPFSTVITSTASASILLPSAPVAVMRHSATQKSAP